MHKNIRLIAPILWLPRVAVAFASLLTATIGMPCLAGEVRVEKDVAYLGPERAEKADLYLPEMLEPGKKYPGVVIIHGGGHLTALLAVSGPECGLDPVDDAEFSCRIQAAVPLYPHCASTWEGGTPLETYDSLPMFAQTHPEAPKLWDSGSPIKNISRDDPPMLLLHGTADKTTPLAQSTSLRAAALEAGVPCELIVIEGAPHAFHLQPEQRDLRQAVIEFFDRFLKPR